MRVANHRLVAAGSRFRVARADSPNAGETMAPRLIVVHFTAGTTAEGAVAWLRDPASQVSAHLVVARSDGAVTQLVSFDRVAWHAGRSEWNGETDVNRFSIGIELDNAGRLERRDGAWRNYAGAVIPDDEVVIATHRNERVEAGWHRFSDAQLAALVEAVAAIRAAYPIEAIVGHDEIAPGRKADPGPAFPMAALRDGTLAPAPPSVGLLRRLFARLRRSQR